MQQLQWTKLSAGFTRDPRIATMLNEKKGFIFFTLLFFLRDYAALVNKHGYIYMAEDEPLTSSVLAKLIGRRKNTVEQGLDYLERFCYIQRDERGIIYLCGWDDMQNMDKYDRYLEKTKNRVAAYRQRQREDATLDVPEDQEEPETFVESEPLPEGVEVIHIDMVEQEQTQTEPTLEEPQAEACNKEQQNITVVEKNTTKSTNEVVKSPVDMAPPETVKPMHLVKSVDDAIEPEPSPVKTSKAIKCYQDCFGMVQGGMVMELLEMEKQWGSDAVCAAIKVSWRKGINRLYYIRGILRNSNGKVEGEVNNGNNTHYGDDCKYKSIDEELDDMFQEAGLL